MADVTGPISSLPGSGHDVPPGTRCDEHPDRPATHRVQGETDSMGSEMHDLCEECFTAHRAAARTADTSGRCDWCKTDAPARRPTRDYDEGMRGPVYMVCSPCIAKANEAARLEMDDSFEAFLDDDGDFDDDEMYADEFYRDSRDDPRDEVTRRREDYDLALRELGRL